MIRVLHLIDSLDLGGAQAVLVNLARFRHREKFVLTVAAMHGHGLFTKALEAEGVRVLSLSREKFPPAYLWTLPRLLRQEKFDIVHCHLFGSNWIGKPLAAACGVPVRVNHDHCNDRVRSGWRLALDRLTNRLSSQVIAVSQSTREALVDEVGLSRDLVTFLPNGVDMEHFQPAEASARDAARSELSLDPEVVVVAGLGRLHPQKNWPLFLQIAQEFPAAQFILAGAGPEEATIQAEAPPNVHLIGLQNPQTVLAAADIFLLTSHYEGTPMTLLEAMASGLPSLVSAVDGCAEILGDEVGGVTAEPGNSRDFVAKLSPLLDSSDLRGRVGRAARNKALGYYDARTQARAVEEMYEMLLRK